MMVSPQSLMRDLRVWFRTRIEYFKEQASGKKSPRESASLTEIQDTSQNTRRSDTLCAAIASLSSPALFLNMYLPFTLPVDRNVHSYSNKRVLKIAMHCLEKDLQGAK